MNLESWNEGLEKAGEVFARLTWRNAPLDHTTHAVRLLQDLQELSRIERLCAADIQRVIVALIMTVEEENNRG